MRKPSGDGTTVTVYISWGNSDDRMSQAQWSSLSTGLVYEIKSYAYQTHGVWYSEGSAPYQNACICVEFENDPEWLGEFKVKLSGMRGLPAYGQYALAWAEAVTEFI